MLILPPRHCGHHVLDWGNICADNCWMSVMLSPVRMLRVMSVLTARYNGALIGLTLALIVLTLYTVLNIVNIGHNAAALWPCQPQLPPESHPHISTRASNEGWLAMILIVFRHLAILASV